MREMQVVAMIWPLWFGSYSFISGFLVANNTSIMKPITSNDYKTIAIDLSSAKIIDKAAVDIVPV